jgi:hypothetical protein
MANEVRFVGGNMLFVDGSLAMSGDCCCAICSADTPAEVAQYIVDNAWRAQLVVTSDDYSDFCGGVGDCSALAGTYTLPYFSTTPFATVGRTVRFRDTFSFTICGTSRSIIAEVQINIGVLGPDLNVSGGGYLNDATSTWVNADWEDGFGLLTCQEIIEISNQALQPLTPAPLSGSCRTVTGGSGLAAVSLIP